MQVFVKNISATIELKNNGMTFDLYETDGSYKGKIKLNRAGMVWCSGKTRLENGDKVSWYDLIEHLESL
jgi:hypothetical protein